MSVTRQVFAAIVGSGFSGLAAAIELKKAGIDDLVVLERASTLGGTWRENRYPGCACDVPSHLYSFSFAPNDWTHAFAPQPEIRAYLERVADDFDVRRHILFERAVTAARWDGARAAWRLRLRACESIGSRVPREGIATEGKEEEVLQLGKVAGPPTTPPSAVRPSEAPREIDSQAPGTGEELLANVLVLAMGALSKPAIPRLRGIERFRGAQFHSARWDAAADLRGKRVAVIGTGASAIQFVPKIQPEVAKLHLFQRTAPWVLPIANRAYGRWERAALRAIPGLRRLYRQLIYWRLEGRVLAFVKYPALMSFVERQARRHIERSIRDPALRDLLAPRFRAGCKRLLLSNEYYPALAQPNVEVTGEPIEEVTAGGIVLAGGRTIDVDAIIYGTGFDVHDYLAGIDVIGPDGANLGARWKAEGAEAYLGTAVAGFPNLFTMTGPNTGLGHTSLVVMIEAQARYIREAVRVLRDRGGAASIAPRPEAQAAYNAWLRERTASAVWSSGCRSWYLDARGRNTTLWPGSTVGFRARTGRLRAEDHVVLPAAAPRKERHPMTPSLSGKVVLVTGAARGIGAETARLLAARGARVSLVGLEPERLEALARELGPGHAAFACDVTDQAALERATAGTVAALGGIDAVVANAGIASNATVAVGPIEALARTIDVNLTGVIRTVSATLPHVAARRGYFLLVSSASALGALPGMSVYAASKIAVEHFGAGLRLEVADRGVEVGVALPSWIDTDLVRDQQTDLRSFGRLLERLPWPFGGSTSAPECAEAFVDAIARRERKIYVPRALGFLAPLRTLLWTRPVQDLLARQMETLVPELEREVRALGRPFGRTSVGAAPRS